MWHAGKSISFAAEFQPWNSDLEFQSRGRIVFVDQEFCLGNSRSITLDRRRLFDLPCGCRQGFPASLNPRGDAAPHSETGTGAGLGEGVGVKSYFVECAALVAA